MTPEAGAKPADVRESESLRSGKEYLITDVATEEMSLYHSDLDHSHDDAIRNALSHVRYTDTKTEYVDTMIAEEGNAL